jgi:hypothetical protein
MDWFAVAKNSAHAQHHIGIDIEGNYFCRECSHDRVYVLRDDEVKRLLLWERTK